MNKYLAKGVASALLITTVAGGMALAPINQDAEAASSYTKKLCSHTSISTSARLESSNSPLAINTKQKIAGGVTVKTNGKYNKKTYAHNHAYGYSFTTDYKTCKNTHSITTRKNAKDTKVTVTGDSPFTKKGGKYVANATYSYTATSKKSSTTKWGKSSNKNNIKGYYACSECKLSHNSAAGTMTIKCPLCKVSAKIAPRTGKITVVKK